MRIVIVHSRYRSAAPSGENRVVDQEAAALSALGHQVELFQRHSDDIERWPSARKAALPASVVWNGGARRDLAALLLAAKPDVVHIHNTFPLLSPSVLFACRDARVPVVATLHNYKLACASGDFFRDGTVCHDCAHGFPAGALRHGCYRKSRAATVPVVLAAVTHRRAWRTLVSAYACISASQQELLRGIGLPRQRVFVRHNMIPSRPVRRSERRAEVVYAGRLDAAKGVPVLLSGWDRYLAQRGGAAGLTLVVAGSGPLGPEVEAWAASRPSVRIVGQLAPDACAAAMAAARAVVLPSAWEETFGLAAIEAMALGTPPLAAAHGSFPELVTDGVDGVLFQAGDPNALGTALLDADINPGRYEEYGIQARKTYQRDFDPSDSLRKLLDIYEYAITNPVSQPVSGRCHGPE